MEYWRIIFEVTHAEKLLGWLEDSTVHHSDVTPRAGELISFLDQHPFAEHIWLDAGQPATVRRVHHQIGGAAGPTTLVFARAQARNVPIRLNSTAQTIPGGVWSAADPE